VCRAQSSPARAPASFGASRKTAFSSLSKVNVVVATALQPGRAQCRRITSTVPCDARDSVAIRHGIAGFSAVSRAACHDASVASWCVRVPASSANLGPAFDALGLALSVHLEVGPSGGPAPETHPAVRAFRHAGGVGPLSVHAQFPGGRGLGFSGAARVAGLLAAARQQGMSAPAARAFALREGTALEGHADNVAASLLGGVVATGGGRATRVPLGVDGVIVVWVPDRETPTRAARRVLPEHVPFEDAVFNVGRTALLVAALASGDTESLRAASEDRLHQDVRLARVPETRTAMTAAVRAGAWAAWLSGSGPSAAALVERSRAEAVAAALPTTGRAMVLEIDEQGAIVE
jgi:homoserine kinase